MKKVLLHVQICITFVGPILFIHSKISIYMDVKIYTQNQTLFQNFNTVLYRYFEYFLLLIVAVIGLTCSAFAISDNSSMPSEPYKQIVVYNTAKKSAFDKYVDITGDKKTDSELSFVINLDIHASRYVMEMGDGRRMILTQPNFTYSYPTKGEYILELKEIKNGLISLVGDKKLKIK